MAESNVGACEETLAALREDGKITDADAALVQAARSIAEQLDGRGAGNSQLWREYRETLEALTADDDDSGEAAAVFGRLQSSVFNTSSN